MSKVAHLVVWSAMFVVALDAQNLNSEGQLSCVDYLELPTRGLIAASAPASGTVRAVAKIDAKGQSSQLKLTGGNFALQGEVRVAMNSSRFSATCNGRLVEFIFGFTLE